MENHMYIQGNNYKFRHMLTVQGLFCQSILLGVHLAVPIFLFTSLKILLHIAISQHARTR